MEGLQSKIKQRKAFTQSKSNNVYMVQLQESQLMNNELIRLKYGWIHQVYFSCVTSSSRGVVILIN